MVKIIRGDRVGKLGRLAVGCSATVVDPTTKEVLLIRRADNGHWAVLGGYMEAGESFSEACAREGGWIFHPCRDGEHGPG